MSVRALLLFATVAWCVATPASAQSRPPATAPATAGRDVLNPPGLAPLVPAYSVAIRDGEWIFVSGMTGMKPGTQDIVSGGISVQTRQTMENIRTALVSGGATMADVAECTVFLKDIADYAAMNAEYVTFFPVNPPARATLAVTALPRPAALVEVKCTARLRSARPASPPASPSAAPPATSAPASAAAPSGARRFDRALALEDSGYTSASASVVITGVGSPFNGTLTISDSYEDLFTVAITNADIKERKVIPSGLATLS
jgi:2-iminobutanoate/2-iminopropanoate deaminase